MRRFCWIAAVAGFALVFLSGITNAADTVEKTQPPAVLLAKVWREGFDPADFWVSEKLDGVRAIWDGHALRSVGKQRVQRIKRPSDLPPVMNQFGLQGEPQQLSIGALSQQLPLRLIEGCMSNCRSIFW